MATYTKRLLALVSAAALSLAVVACGSSNDTPSDSGSTQQSDGGADDAAQSDGGELVLWHMENTPERVKAFQDLADTYNATDPAYTVKIQVQDWDQVYTKIAAAAQASQAPDILFSIPDFTTYVRGLGLGEDVSSTVDKLNDRNAFIDAATAPYTEGDKVWAVPLYGMTQILWYRADLFEKAGISEPPAVWSDLLADAEALASGDQFGIAVPAGKNLATDQVIYSLMVTAGAANMFDDDGNVSIDDQATTDSFDLYKKLVELSPSDAGSYSWPEPQAALNNGSAAMAIEKGQYLAPFEEESGRPAGDLGCAPIPTPDDGGQPGSIYYSNGAMVLSDNSDRQAGADAFLSWLLEPEQYGDFLNAEPGLFLPVTADGAAATNWRTNPVVDTYSRCIDVMLNQAQTGALFGFVDGQYITGIGEISGQNILAQAVQRMAANDESPADAVAWAQTAMQDAIS